MDQNSKLCCNGDQVEIMQVNFQQIDSIFGQDCPMCAINLKKLWCNFACNSKQSDFINGTGYIEKTMDQGQIQNFTKVRFNVNQNFACTLF